MIFSMLLWCYRWGFMYVGKPCWALPQTGSQWEPGLDNTDDMGKTHYHSLTDGNHGWELNLGPSSSEVTWLPLFHRASKAVFGQKAVNAVYRKKRQHHILDHCFNHVIHAKYTALLTLAHSVELGIGLFLSLTMTNTTMFAALYQLWRS